LGGEKFRLKAGLQTTPPWPRCFRREHSRRLVPPKPWRRRTFSRIPKRVHAAVTRAQPALECGAPHRFGFFIGAKHPVKSHPFQPAPPRTQTNAEAASAQGEAFLWQVVIRGLLPGEKFAHNPDGTVRKNNVRSASVHVADFHKPWLCGPPERCERFFIEPGG
jgi:hypothetical protein